MTMGPVSLDIVDLTSNANTLAKFRLVKILNGPILQFFSDNCAYIASIISDRIFLDTSFLCLQYRGLVLHDQFTLTEQSVPRDAVLECFVKLNGAGKNSHQSSMSEYMVRNKRRCGNLSVTDMGGCSSSSTDLEHLLPAERNMLLDPADSRQEIPRAPTSTASNHGLWIENVDLAKKALVQINKITLQSINSVKGLEQAINYDLDLDLNKDSLLFLGLLEENGQRNSMLVVSRIHAGKIELKYELDSWTYEVKCEQQPGNQEFPILLSNTCYHTCSFEHCSSTVIELLRDARIFQASTRAKTLYKLFSIVPPQTQYSDQYVDILQSGLLGLGANYRPASSMARNIQTVDSEHRDSDFDRPDQHPGNIWRSRSFLNIVCPADIGLCEHDKTLDGETLSMAQSLLMEFHQKMNEGQCVLRHRTRGKKIDIGNGSRAYQYIQISCRGKSKLSNHLNCAHAACFKLFPSESREGTINPDLPIFRQVTASKRAVVKGHTCCQNQSAVDCTKHFQGRKRTWDRSIVHMARVLYVNGESMRTIMLALGFDESDDCGFQSEQKRLYDTLRNMRRAEIKTQLPRLRAHINTMFAEGHLAYAAMDVTPRCEGKYRFYWSLIENAYNMKLAHTELLSYDFKYLLLDGLAFGIMTIISPSGNIIPISFFIVESENKDSVAWIVDQYHKNYARLGIDCQTRVWRPHDSSIFLLLCFCSFSHAVKKWNVKNGGRDSYLSQQIKLLMQLNCLALKLN